MMDGSFDWDAAVDPRILHVQYQLLLFSLSNFLGSNSHVQIPGKAFLSLDMYCMSWPLYLSNKQPFRHSLSRVELYKYMSVNQTALKPWATSVFNPWTLALLNLCAYQYTKLKNTSWITEYLQIHSCCVCYETLMKASQVACVIYKL